MKQHKEYSLQISTEKHSILSPHQKQFNTLTQKIEALTKKIDTDNVKLEECMKAYAKKIPTLQTEQALAKYAMAKTLADSVEYVKYSNKQYHNIVECILWLCNDCFANMEPTPEMQAFYDKWSPTSLKEEAEETSLMAKQIMKEQLKSQFGVDIDFSDFDDSPEGYARIQQRFQEALKDKLENAQNEPKPSKKKTKKQLAREAIAQEEEDSKQKSVRSIYVALAKVLHPDTVQDPEEKKIREELMKKVTIAYNNKDIAALLKLEIEWVTNETNNLENLTEDKLKIYIATLKQQVAELEMEYRMLVHHPRFQAISEFFGYGIHAAMNKVLNKEMKLQYEIKQTQKRINLFRKDYNKQTILKFVSEIQEEIAHESFFGGMYDLFD